MTTEFFDHNPHRCGVRSGFSILEVLVAMAVLGLLLVILFQIIGHTLQATRTSSQQMSGDGKTRAVLDAIGNDLANLVDADALTVFYRADAAGNVELAFLTQSRRPVTVSASDYRFASVVYRLEDAILHREAVDVAWSEPLTNLILRPGAKNVLARGILRLSAVAVLDDGTLAPLTMDSMPWNSAEMYGAAIPGNFRGLTLSRSPVDADEPRVRAITVAVAALDDQTIKIPGAEAIGGSLPTPSSGETPYQAWSDLIASGGLSAGPPPVVAALRIAQRTYQLK